jgi:hypothetical protein
MDPFEHDTGALPPHTTLRRALMILGFFTVLFAGDRLLALGLEALQSQSGFRFSRIYAAEAGAAQDVLIFGDSRGVNGFYVPGLAKATGQRMLNLSYNGMAPPVAEALLLDYLARHPAPKRLIIEPTSVLAKAGLAPTLHSYAGQSQRLQALIEDEDALKANAGRVSHLYRFNSELFLRALYYLGRSDQGWINDYRIGEAQLEALRAAPVQTQAPMVRPEALAALARMVQAGEAAGSEVHLVIGPYLPLYRNTLAWWPEFVALLERTTGHAVLDLSLAVHDDAAFADRLHLNRRGAPPLLEHLRDAGIFGSR